jgi:UDP-3-O-[3-hydroxymyristoyl] glucosamine N-acyltransferase
MELTISQLAEQLGAELAGDGKKNISAVAPIESAGENDVTFATNSAHIAKLASSNAAAAIVQKRIEGADIAQLIVKDVNSALITSLNIFAPKLKAPAKGIDPSAVIAKDVQIGPDVSIGPGVFIDNGVNIGENTVIAAGCKIGQNSKVGKNCRIDSNVVIYYNCTIGNNVVIQANTTIGSTGFGYAFINGEHRLIPHNGGVIIEDCVEIGANCCVDRAKFDNTIIGAGTKIDNLVQIAHNVKIGKCCLIVAQVGIAGSCKIGDGVVLGGQAGLVDNVEIGDGAMIGAQSGVMQNISAGQKVLGSPAIEIRNALKFMSLTKRLPELLKQLGKRVDKLEASKNDKD